MTKYRELLKEYEEAVKEAQKFSDLYYRECQKNNSQEKDDKIKKLEGKLATEISINQTNADVIQYLAARRFGDDSKIEFAAIKTYRGWKTLYLNGEELNPNGKDVTIWADRQEPVRIEVTG